MLKAVARLERDIMTMQGRLQYKRYLMYPEGYASKQRLMEMQGVKSIAPLDEFLGIDNIPFAYTTDLALHIAKTAACSSSYEDAADRLKEYGVGPDQARRVTDYIGEIINTYDKQRIRTLVSTYDPKRCRAAKRGRRPKEGFTLYLEMDGAFFNTRGKNIEGSSWKETKLGLAFKSNDLVKSNDGSFHVGSREYLSTNEGVEEFRSCLIALAISNGLYDANRVVILSDGAPWITNTRDSFFPFAIRILDLYHLKEKVGKFSFQVFKGKKQEAKRAEWVKRVNEMLEEGKWRDVLKLEEVGAYKGVKVNFAAGEVNLYKYIDDNSDFIDYPKYRTEGMFVGSGAIESGNKNVMQRRLKLSGMRWKIVRAQNLMALRCKLMSSNLWDMIVVPQVTKMYKKGNKATG